MTFKPGLVACGLHAVCLWNRKKKTNIYPTFSEAFTNETNISSLFKLRCTCHCNNFPLFWYFCRDLATERPFQNEFGSHLFEVAFNCFWIAQPLFCFNKPLGRLKGTSEDSHSRVECHCCEGSMRSFRKGRWIASFYRSSNLLAQWLVGLGASCNEAWVQ